MNDRDVEQAIQAAGADVAPRLTPHDIDAVIVSETITILPSGKCRVCELTLRNGFTVTGTSALVSIENDVPAVGEGIARDNARDKVRQLEGYLLQERLYQSRQPAQVPAGPEDEDHRPA